MLIKKHRLEKSLFGVSEIAILEAQIQIKPRVFRGRKESTVYKGKTHKVVKVVWQEL